MHKIDHFAIGAISLDAGVDALETTLGVRVPDGSKHTLMSTHNCVMQSGNENKVRFTCADRVFIIFKDKVLHSAELP